MRKERRWRIFTNLHPKNRYSGCCPFVARSFNRSGLEELATAKRKAWFPLASKAKSGNLVAVSFNVGRVELSLDAGRVELSLNVGRVELSQESLAKTLNDGVGSEEAGVTTEKTTKRTGTKNLNMTMDRPAEMNVKWGSRSRTEREFVVKSYQREQAFNAAQEGGGMVRRGRTRGS